MPPRILRLYACLMDRGELPRPRPGPSPREAHRSRPRPAHPTTLPCPTKAYRAPGPARACAGSAMHAGRSRDWTITASPLHLPGTRHQPSNPPPAYETATSDCKGGVRPEPQSAPRAGARAGPPRRHALPRLARKGLGRRASRGLGRPAPTGPGRSPEAADGRRRGAGRGSPASPRPCAACARRADATAHERE
jgi:hypothetical protein